MEKFILNINNEYAQDYSCPAATFALCSHGEKLPRQGRLPDVVQRVYHLSKLPQGSENSCEQLQEWNREAAHAIKLILVEQFCQEKIRKMQWTRIILKFSQRAVYILLGR